VRLKNGEKLLTLEEAMDISGETPLYLDVKEAEALEPLVWTLRRRRTTDLIVASSDDRFLQQFQKRLDIPTSLQLESPEIGGAKRARELGATFVHPCWENFGDPLKLLLKGFLHNFTNAGLKIILWHEENPKALLKARGLGNALYGITTDRPDLAKSILRGGGHGTPP
jgi:glycerophosphoryl diester phosphodiesterase